MPSETVTPLHRTFVELNQKEEVLHVVEQVMRMQYQIAFDAALRLFPEQGQRLQRLSHQFHADLRRACGDKLISQIRKKSIIKKLVNDYRVLVQLRKEFLDMIEDALTVDNANQ